MSGRSRRRRDLCRGLLVVAILAATSAPLAAQLAVEGAGIVALSEHRVDAGNGVEQASGVLWGAEGRLFVGSRVEVFAHAATGKLTAATAGADSRDLSEAELRASVLTVSWLALHAGLSSRAYTTALARQHWTALRFGGEARFAFVGGNVAGALRGEFLPAVTASGLDKPSRAFAAGAGLDWKVNAFIIGLRYELERYDFPLAAGVERREQLSTLTASVGLRPRRRTAP